MGLIQKFKNMFFKPDTSDQERLDRWRNEVDEADRIKDLHLKARKQEKKAKEATKMPISAPYKREKKGLIKKKGLTVEDFEKAEQAKKKPSKPISYNF